MTRPLPALLPELLDHFQEALLLIDERGHLGALSAPARRLGLPELERARPGDHWHSSLPAAVQPEIAELLAQLERSTQATTLVAARAGLWLELRGVTLGGGLRALYLRDVTGQRGAARLFDTLPLGLTYHDAQTRILTANAAAERILGQSLAQLQGRVTADPDWRAIGPDGHDLPLAEFPVSLALTTGEAVKDAQMGVYHPQIGAWRWLRVTALPQYDEAAQQDEAEPPHAQADREPARPSGVCCIFEDVTDAVQARRELLASEQRYRLLVQASGQIVWEADAAGLLSREQPEWTAFTGQPLPQLLGLGWLEALHPEDRDATAVRWAEARQTGRPFLAEHRLRRRDGVYVPALVHGVPLRPVTALETATAADPPGAAPETVGWIGVHTDLSQLRQTQEELRQTNARLTQLNAELGGLNGELEARASERAREIHDLTHFNRLLLESAGEGIFGLDPAGLIRFANPAAAEILGYRVEELLGRPSHTLLHARYPDGRPYPVSACPIHQTLTTGQTHRRDGEVFWNRQGEAVPVEYVSAPLAGGLSGDAGQQGAVVLFQDVTERQQARQAEQTLIGSLRRSNFDLEQFAYVASHDLQEPLRTVGSYAELLSRRYRGQLDPRADVYLGHMLGGVDRMRQLIGDLLAYSRVGRSDVPGEPVSLDAVMAGVAASLELEVQAAGASLSWGELPLVQGHTGQLDLLLTNLITNALKFRQAGQPAVVRVSAAPDPKVPGYWQCQVSDNGVGIEAEYQERVFGLFQRLHRREDYPGTGLGLAICRKIVEHHGGQIWLISVAGQGTHVYFTLPVAAPPSSLRRPGVPA